MLFPILLDGSAPQKCIQTLWMKNRKLQCQLSQKVKTMRTWNLLEFLPNTNTNHYQDTACKNKMYISKAVTKNNIHFIFVSFYF